MLRERYTSECQSTGTAEKSEHPPMEAYYYYSQSYKLCFGETMWVMPTCFIISYGDTLLGVTLWKTMWMTCENHVDRCTVFTVISHSFHRVFHRIFHRREKSCEKSLWKTCENHVKWAPPFHTVFHLVVCEKKNSEKHVKTMGVKGAYLWITLWKYKK